MPRLRFLSTLLVLLIGSYAVVAQPQAPAQDSPITISGSVQSQGKPLSGALITLWEQPYGDPSERSTVATGRTDAEGNYTLKNVPTGNYLIRATAPGYVSGKENNSLAMLRYVTVVGGKNVGPFNFDLLCEGVITGIVTDADGKPLPGIPITLINDVIPDSTPTYAENLRTDDQGHYRIAGMPAGKYRVAAGHWPVMRGTSRGEPGYRRVFFPNAADEAEARVIELSVGSELTGIDFNLGQPVKTFSVRAKTVDDRTGKPVEGLEFVLTAYLKGKVIGVISLRDNRASDRGEIVLQNIPPGEYVISSPGAKGVFRKGDPQPTYSAESRHFEVVDKDLGDVEIRVTRGASVAGFVVVEGPASADILAKLPEMSLWAIVETNPIIPTPISRATIRPDGSFLLTGLRAGKLKLNFAAPAPGTPLPLSFVRTERDGVKLESDLEIQPGEEITGLRLVMAYANSGIHGLVKLDDGSVPQGLIGMASVQGNVLGNRSVVNQNGEFILQNLVAGEYKLVVSARDAIGRYWMVEQKVKIEDDKISEARMVLDSKVKPNPSAASKSYLRP
ncbi:MAG: carboxypeptidase regulatory-like domain-containing protein [Pyrinomonadaceae bacterium]